MKDSQDKVHCTAASELKQAGNDEMFINYSCHYILIVGTTFKNESLLCVGVSGCTDAMAHVWWSQRTTFGSWFSFYHVGPGH